MTNEEAVKNLKILEKRWTEDKDMFSPTIIIEIDDEFMQSIYKAIEALKKQIPKKPKYVEVERDSMDMETGEEYTYKIDEAHCSCCDFIIGADHDFFDECYCENCGQKIDWRE